MPILEEGLRVGCAVAAVGLVAVDLVVDFAVGAEEVGEGVAEVVTISLAALYPTAVVKMTE